MPRYLFPKSYADIVARLRVPSGFLMLAAFAFFARPTTAAIVQSLPISLAGLALRAWAAGHLEKNQRLIRSGPYRYLRNPLYLGSLVVALGVAMAGQSWVLAGFFVAVFLLVFLPVMELEEQHLRQLFPAYARYADEVPLLVPKFPGQPDPYPFRWAMYWKNQEYKAFLGYCIAMALLWWRT